MPAEYTLIEAPARSGKTTTLLVKAKEIAAAGGKPLFLSATDKDMREITRVPMRPAPQTTKDRKEAQERLDEANQGILFGYHLSLEAIQRVIVAEQITAIFLDEVGVRSAEGSVTDQGQALALTVSLPVYQAIDTPDAPKPTPL